MRRRSRVSGQPAKARRRKMVTPKRRKAPKTKQARSPLASSQETNIAQLTREHNEALEQQSATAEVLRIISASPTELRPVLEVVVRSAARYCKADDVTLFELDGQDLREAAHWGALRHGGDSFRFPCTRGSVAGRVVLERKPVHVADLQAETENFPEGSALARRFGHRTIASVPLLREGVAVGTLQLRRIEVNPFTDKQIALLGTFAAQAVIAIENARLLSELRQRTTDLSESLEQQTATADVLSVISSSPGELTPVFQTILENATRICEAKFGTLYLREGEGFRTVAAHNAPPAYIEARTRELIRPAPDTALGGAAATKRVVHIADIKTIPSYVERNPFIVTPVELGGYRTVLAVPMLKNNELIGVITVNRQEVRPFTDKQIALMQNFAAQAVIAIENARLLNELRQSLEQQTATANVLGVISSSPGELEPVFQAVLENAVRICEAKFANLFLAEGNAFRNVALYGAPRAFEEARRKQPLLKLSTGTALDRMAATKSVAQTLDAQTDPSYRDDPQRALFLKQSGGRTVVCIPLMKEDNLVGGFSVYRQEVRPFTEKQIALLKNFAAQAVIAIENARLLNDLNKLNQQLEQRVADQVGEIERMARLRRFLPQQVADLIVASGTEKQLESHRREITALFCDLRGFTGFSESSDPEDVMALLAEYHAAIGKIIIRYSGTLERYAGDGVMVVFNDPVPVENPALQAVLMALEMRDAIGALTETWHRWGHDIGFGIGIAHGFATLGTIGFEGRFDYAAIGTVSNVASRLCDEAKSGQVLISPRVLTKVENAVTVESVGEFTLKGIRRPMMAYNVLATSPSKSN
jgi:class 3 adenylate cyclase/putative methionine-R-sulfoxide reductase with GAF domain